MQEDIYHWRAVYKDGTVIDELDETRPDGRGISEIDASQVAMIDLIPQTEMPIHRVDVPDGATPVFFRRRRVEIPLGAVDFIKEEQTQHGTIHCIGWKRDDEGSYCFIGENGVTVLTSDLQAV